jgi:hypothetical protein
MRDPTMAWGDACVVGTSLALLRSKCPTHTYTHVLLHPRGQLSGEDPQRVSCWLSPCATGPFFGKYSFFTWDYLAGTGRRNGVGTGVGAFRIQKSKLYIYMTFELAPQALAGIQNGVLSQTTE